MPLRASPPLRFVPAQRIVCLVPGSTLSRLQVLTTRPLRRRTAWILRSRGRLSGDRVVIGGLPAPLKNTLPGLVLSAFNRSPLEPAALDPEAPRRSSIRTRPSALPPLDALVTPPPELGSLGSCADAAPAVAHRIAVIAATATSVAGRPPVAPGSTRASHPFFALALKSRLLFLGPTGLAVGLALKELRYGRRSDSPLGASAPLGSPAPRCLGHRGLGEFH